MRALVLLALLGCAHGVGPVAPAVGCDSERVEPVIACGHMTTLRYDGCRWACQPWFGTFARQSECAEIIVNGYSVGSCGANGER